MDGDVVENERVLLLVENNAVEMFEAAARGTKLHGRGAVARIGGGDGGRFAQIVEQASGGGNGLRVARHAEAVESGDPELFGEDALGIARFEDPFVEARFGGAEAVEFRSGGAWEKSGGLRQEDFAGTEDFEFVAKARFGGGSREFRGAEFSRGEIDESETDRTAAAMASNRGEIIVLARFEKRRAGCGAGRENANDFAADEFLRARRIFHLLADGDFVPGANQTRDVIFGGVIGNATHGHGLALFAIARRESDLEFARGGDGVVEEKLIEIAETEEQQGVGMLALDGVILLHQRSGRFGHAQVVFRAIFRIVFRFIHGWKRNDYRG